MSNDALTPQETAAKYLIRAQSQVSRTVSHPLKTFALAIMAGLYISLGAFGGMVVTYDSTNGPTKVLGGVVFAVGMLCVVNMGAELFTSNVTLLLAMLSRKVKVWHILLNWLIVYIGNFTGGVLTALLMFGGGQHDQNGSGLQSLRVAQHKCGLEFQHIVVLGLFANIIVFIIKWMATGSRSVEGKTLTMILPVVIFYLGPFEHSVANSFTLPYALFVKQWSRDTYFEHLLIDRNSFSELTWGHFFRNQLGCVIGHIIGGFIMSAAYWFSYVHVTEAAAPDSTCNPKLPAEHILPNSPVTPLDVEMGVFSGQPKAPFRQQRSYCEDCSPQTA